MKKLLIFICTLLGHLAFTEDYIYYVFSKSGLNLRADQNTSSKVLATIPYGEPVTILQFYLEEITLDNVRGNWVKVRYKNLTGYMVDIYLLPHHVPNANTQTLQDYLAQVSTVGFKTESIHKYCPDQDESSSSYQKTLYKNGMEAQEFYGYESAEYVYLFPDWRFHHAFFLLKSLGNFEYLNRYKVNFPTEGVHEYKNKDQTSIVTVNKLDDKITINYLEHSNTYIEITNVSGQVAIIVSEGP